MGRPPFARSLLGAVGALASTPHRWLSALHLIWARVVAGGLPLWGDLRVYAGDMAVVGSMGVV